MGHRSVNHILVWLFMTWSMTLGMPCLIHAQTNEQPNSSYTIEERNALKAIHTILLGGKVTTWLDYDYPLYDPISNLKVRLEEAGFHVVSDPSEAHDATLGIDYAETPSGTFRGFEQGTLVNFTATFYHPMIGIIFSYHFDAEPSEVPTGALYWDTIGNLEADPLFFYQAHILKAWLLDQTPAGNVLIGMMLRPYIDASYEKPDERPGQAFVRRSARINTIRAVGETRDPKAQAMLWKLTKLAVPEERKIAVEVLGTTGDASFIPKLSQLAETDLDQDVQRAVEEAIRFIHGGE